MPECSRPQRSPWAGAAVSSLPQQADGAAPLCAPISRPFPGYLGPCRVLCQGLAGPTVWQPRFSQPTPPSLAHPATFCALWSWVGAGCFLVPGVGSMQRCCCHLPVLIGWASCRLTREPAVNKARAGFGKVSGLWCAGMRQLWHPGAELCMGWGWEGDGAASWPHGCSSSRVHALKPSKRFATAERGLAGAVILIPCTYTSLAQARCVWQGGGR